MKITITVKFLFEEFEGWIFFPTLVAQRTGGGDPPIIMYTFKEHSERYAKLGLMLVEVGYALSVTVQMR